MEQQNKLKDTTLRFFHDLFDLMVVNWLWVLCCIPVVTIGPATCGMYTVTLKLAREEPVNPVKDFFRGFKENFKSGLLLGLVAAILLVAAAGDIWLLLQLSGWMQGVYLAVAVLVSGMFLTVIAYAFALLAMFDNPLKIHVFNAFKLVAAFPIQTLGIWLVLLIPVIAALTMAPAVLQTIGFLYLVMGFSGPAYGASCILRHLFDRVNGTPIGEVPPTTEE